MKSSYNLLIGGGIVVMLAGALWFGSLLATLVGGFFMLLGGILSLGSRA